MNATRPRRMRSSKRGLREVIKPLTVVASFGIVRSPSRPSIYIVVNGAAASGNVPTRGKRALRRLETAPDRGPRVAVEAATRARPASPTYVTRAVGTHTADARRGFGSSPGRGLFR